MKKTVFALGFFDGLHLGHGELLHTARSRADAMGREAKLLTFDVHPDSLVFGTQVELINSPEDRELMARQLFSMDGVELLHFDRSMMEMPWEQFVDEVLIGQHHAAHVVCGDNFRFGHRGQGTPERLSSRCAEHGVGCDICPDVLVDGQTVSSTRIREAIRSGDMEQANRLLGHPHQLTGVVQSGRQLGRTIGIPTANLHLPEGLMIPAFGVYVTDVSIDGRLYAAVTNVGTRPTVGGHHITVEPWILDYSGDLYGRTITLRFHRHLRPETKFDSLEALQREIFRNAEQTKAYFQQHEIQK